MTDDDRIHCYGALGCSCCGIPYGFFESIVSYIESLGGGENAEDTAEDAYMKKFLKAMPAPCAKCSQEYINEHAYLANTYNIWYERRQEKLRDLASRYNSYKLYEVERCTSGGGAPCRCCGD